MNLKLHLLWLSRFLLNKATLINNTKIPPIKNQTIKGC